MRRYIGILLGAVALALPAGSALAQATGPTIVVETSRGTFEFETFTDTAPKTVAHIVALVKRNFYTGQRIHRVVPDFVVQFGDPQTRDMTKKDRWGTGGSGANAAIAPVGVAEISKKHTHDKK